MSSASRRKGVVRPEGHCLSHQSESFERLNKALVLAKGTPLSERMASGKPRSRKSRSKAVNRAQTPVSSSREVGTAFVYGFLPVSVVPSCVSLRPTRKSRKVVTR